MERVNKICEHPVWKEQMAQLEEFPATEIFRAETAGSWQACSIGRISGRGCADSVRRQGNATGAKKRKITSYMYKQEEKTQ